MAGLLAARVLREHFERVTVIDRDHYGASAEYRAGVPQSRHLHVFLQRGQQILVKLLPELEAEWDAAGVPLLNVTRDCNSVIFGGPLPRYVSRHVFRSCSRTWLESTVRQLLQRSDGITFLEDTEVTGLVARERTRVLGVQLRRRGQGLETLHADFVVDASGRNSKASDWLGALGYATASITTINAFLGYATRWYRIPDNVSHDWQGAIAGSEPATGNSRGGALFPVEGKRWIATLGGIAEQQPPTDEAGFLEFSKRLLTPTIHDAIVNAEPISPIYGYRRTENRWVHYEQLPSWPEGFIVMGDAACCFNPVYGQGMTVAALEAELLASLLSTQGRNLRSLARTFQRQLPKVFQGAWLLSTGEDFRWPTTAGGKPSAATRCAHWYVDRLFYAMPHHEPLVEAFVSVQHLMEPPSALFRPAVTSRVFSHALRTFVDKHMETRRAAAGTSARDNA